MTKEEKELLLLDLCARVLYGVKVQHYENETFLVDADVEYVHGDYVKIKNKDKEVYIMAVKPYLRPLSSMTEEEKEEYTSYCFEQPFLQKDKTPNLGSVPMCIDWLIKNHFDFRGLIPMGLALEAKEGMYKK